MTTCYETSCWCAPIRWIYKCCSSPPPSPTLQPITQVAVVAIGNQPQPTHHRERTWKFSNGRMSYEVSHAVKRDGEL